jgi:hypothetical protein
VVMSEGKETSEAFKSGSMKITAIPITEVKK